MVSGHLRATATSDDSAATYFRISLAVAAFAGAFAIVGNFIMIAPIALLVVAFLAVFYEVRYRGKKHLWARWKKNLAYFAVLVSFLGSAYVAWFVFSVTMEIEVTTPFEGTDEGRSGEVIRFGVRLTNVGRPTSLRDWQAYLLMPGGRVIEGEINRLGPGDSVEIVYANRLSYHYMIPDCDLSFETSRAIQTGDTVYGIIQAFFAVEPHSVPRDARVILKAKDMLGRSIKTEPLVLGDPHQLRTFPCRTKE